MRYLIISAVFLLLLGCKVTTVKDFTKSDVTKKDVVSNPYFSNPKVDYVYKADISVYGNDFSGILVLKKITSQKHRMVFTSQFGSTFFDIEFENGSYKINSIVEQLDRKIILNTLINDFSLVVKEEGTVAERFYNKQYNVLKNQDDKRSNYYFYDLSDVRLQKIVNTTKRREKFSIYFKDVSEDLIAKNIRIDHKNIRLTIELNLLKQ